MNGNIHLGKSPDVSEGEALAAGASAGVLAGPPAASRPGSRGRKKIYGQPDFCKQVRVGVNWACSNLFGV
ncbi:hypothetical protein ACXIUT_26260, partial [Achromobacter denitrificans]